MRESWLPFRKWNEWIFQKLLLTTSRRRLCVTRYVFVVVVVGQKFVDRNVSFILLCFVLFMFHVHYVRRNLLIFNVAGQYFFFF